MTPEELLQAKLYGDAERKPRRTFADVWRISRKALAETAVLEQRVAGGDLQFAQSLHAANKQVLGDAEAQLLAGLQAVVDGIEAIQLGGLAAGLNIFPGVTVQLPENDEDETD